MSTTLDLFIQDFVLTNQHLGVNWSWAALTSRRLMEAGAPLKVFRFKSGGVDHLATGRWIALPDGDCFRIELTHALPFPVLEGAVSEVSSTEYRWDCLRMMSQMTHTELTTETLGSGEKATVMVRLGTKHKGLLNMVFAVRDGAELADPLLVEM
jgi:hypothetical protein